MTRPRPARPGGSFFFCIGLGLLADVGYDDINRKIAKLADRPGEQNHALVAVKIFFGWATRPRSG